MFESDDWDLDQDIFNDIDDKSDRASFHAEVQGTQSKRRKIEGFNDVFSSINSDIDYDKTSLNKNVTKYDDKESRKNLILGMFSKNSLEETVLQNAPNGSKESSDNNFLQSNFDHIQNNGNSQIPRKNLVLEMFNKKNIQGKVIENTVNSQLQKNKLKIKNNSNNIRDESVSKSNNIQFQVSKENLPEESICNKDKQNSSVNSRKQLLHNILKQQSITNAELKGTKKNDASTSKLPQVQPNDKKTLVRRFPGPAGLLPDSIDANIHSVSYLSSLEENEQIKESTDKDLPEYCSQNTKNLFTEGAWQSMLNDLPDGFLKGYEIANIKQIASRKKQYSTKVKFLAGIVEHIDHNHENPSIVLKDFTDSIHGIIHRDISLKYTGLLEPNVVVLLHDVGLLKTSGSFFSKRYHILISPSNLLAIYSNDSHMEHTPHMKSVLEIASNRKIQEENEEEKEDEKEDEINQMLTKALEEYTATTSRHTIDIEEKTNTPKCTVDSSIINSNFNTISNKIFDDTNELTDIDFMDDCFSVSSNIITNSQNVIKFNNSVSSNLKQIDKRNKQQIIEKFPKREKEELIEEDDRKRNSENLLENLKKFSSNTIVKKKFSHTSNSLQANIEHPMSENICIEKVKPKVSNDTSTKKLNTKERTINTSQEELKPVVKELQTSCQSKIESVQFNNNKDRDRLSIQSKLMNFRHVDESPDQGKISNVLQDEQLSESRNKTFEMLCDTENDPDDEMLSQLDMDTILSNYNDKI
ncbi:uncharacterized protein LOC143183054 [Calliopsis andreniformis]|uniref:uncharacterized protein LOC143183054 n=1 Tax=Calliopsis andreniformis TaxID=337506 RepID=UPI003FCD91B7